MENEEKFKSIVADAELAGLFNSDIKNGFFNDYVKALEVFAELRARHAAKTKFSPLPESEKATFNSRVMWDFVRNAVSKMYDHNKRACASFPQCAEDSHDLGSSLIDTMKAIDFYKMWMQLERPDPTERVDLAQPKPEFLTEGDPRN